jgi:hypothetical protein
LLAFHVRLRAALLLVLVPAVAIALLSLHVMDGTCTFLLPFWCLTAERGACRRPCTVVTALHVVHNSLFKELDYTR